METFPYKPDQEAIEKRKTIVIFGFDADKDMQQFISFADQPPKFNSFNQFESDEDEDNVQKKVYVFKSYMPEEAVKKQVVDSSIYVPPSLRNVRTTIKVINIPLEIRDNQEFSKILARDLDLKPLNVFIVLDQESRASRGYSYVTFDSLESAKNAISRIDGFAIDSNLLGAEIAKKRPNP